MLSDNQSSSPPVVRRLTSYYPGDEDVQSDLNSLSETYDPKRYWAKHKPDLNDLIAKKHIMAALPPQRLFNPGQGRADSWQLNESALDFVKRVPPLTTPQTSCEWIWVHNPYVQPENASNLANLISRGEALLQQSLQTRSNIQAQGASKPKTTISRSLNQESRLLQQRIADLAVETKVLPGKVRFKHSSSPQQADTLAPCGGRCHQQSSRHYSKSRTR
jgi:hypothetical protein